MRKSKDKKRQVEIDKPKFSEFLTSSIVTVTVAKSRTFYLHFDLLIAESDRFSNGLTGEYRESGEKTIDLVEEDAEIFGFFVEYLYRDCSILSRNVQHYSEYVTLARLYAMGERLQAPKFKAYSSWRFIQALSKNTDIPNESICELLRIACEEITERVAEDPMRSQIFWYAGAKIANLQKSDTFHQLLHDIPDVGRSLCLWIGQGQPTKIDMPDDSQSQRFAPESEHSVQHSSKPILKVD